MGGTASNAMPKLGIDDAAMEIACNQAVLYANTLYDACIEYMS